MDVVNLRWRKTMQLKVWILRTQRSQQVFVTFDSKTRMQSSLHQDPGSTQRDRFVDLFANLIDRSHIGVRRARPAIESAKCANDVADIRVIDVPIDDVSDDVVRVAALPNYIGSSANRSNIVRLKQG